MAEKHKKAEEEVLIEAAVAQLLKRQSHLQVTKRVKQNKGVQVAGRRRPTSSERRRSEHYAASF